MFTKDFELPSDEELTTEELNISTPALRAGAFHMGKECEAERNEFMLCRNEENDPRKCVPEGKAVTACALSFFRKIKKSCLEEFNQYANCLDKSSADLGYRHCRNTQAVFDKCVLENLNVERPDYGYFCRAKVHDTERPKPEGYVPLEITDGPQPYLSEDVPVRKAKYGSRFHWLQ
ncbi:NADH dehydrogenase [ubiquinone] 1 alpha subcomplex subunit 8-like [Oratosquilla oratoria]|uniref:NADH dehydrogenase [ubiquinone] 1 alpha subcomplex subunit 8-like n=1 Tax=Oratosquilla oratoria TaxID=337810 RepID=UPI003F763361